MNHRIRKAAAVILGTTLAASAAYAAVTFLRLNLNHSATVLDANGVITSVSSSDSGTAMDRQTDGTLAAYHLGATEPGAVAADGKSVPVTVTKVYGGYRSPLSVNVQATGTEPLKVQGVVLERTSGPAWTPGATDAPIKAYLASAVFCGKDILPAAAPTVVAAYVDFGQGLTPGAAYGYKLALDLVPASVYVASACTPQVAP